MAILDEILARLPEERHKDFLRVVHAMNLGADSHDLTQAYLAVEALSPLLDALRPLAEETPARIESVLRTQAEPLAAKIGPTVVAALKSEIVADLTAAHDAYASYIDRNKKTLSDIEDDVTRKVARIADTAERANMMGAARWSVAAVILALVVAFHAPAEFGIARAGYNRGFSAGYRSGAVASFRNDATEYLHQRRHWDDRVQKSGVR